MAVAAEPGCPCASEPVPVAAERIEGCDADADASLATRAAAYASIAERREYCTASSGAATSRAATASKHYAPGAATAAEATLGALV